MTLINQATPEQEKESLLTTVWADGKWYRRESFEAIRERALFNV